MSKFGFDKILRSLSNLESEFLHKGIELARQEFDYNFMSRSNAESGASWGAVRRPNPPPILEVTGTLRDQAVRSGHVSYRGGRAILTIDPIDERGRGYAQYHQDGIGRVVERAFVTQSRRLTNDQENLLNKLVDKSFRI